MITDDAQRRETERQRFDAHLAEVMPVYGAGRFADALALVRAVAPDLLSYRSDTAQMAACMLALLGRRDEAYDELRAAFAEGGWWARGMLEYDEDLASLRELSGFAELAERWRSLLGRGVAVVAPTSSQRMTPARPGWPDPATGTRDIGNALAAEAVASAGLPVQPIVTAGLSAGGRQALNWALTGKPVAAQAFLLVCPSVRLDNLELMLPAVRPVRGHIMVGSDDALLDDVIAVVDRLRTEGIDTELDVIDGLGHEYPSDLDGRAGEALDRLLAAG